MSTATESRTSKQAAPTERLSTENDTLRNHTFRIYERRWAALMEYTDRHEIIGQVAIDRAIRVLLADEEQGGLLLAYVNTQPNTPAQ